jgi:NADH-quinone oxidoreductase subunit J
METFLFYLFSGLALSSAFMVVLSYNPVHSVLFLILVFCNATGILLLLEVEFLGLVFLVVYVGAIAVLFLFVVMMLNIKIGSEKEAFKYLPIGFILGFLFILEVLVLLNKDLVQLFYFYPTDFYYSEWFFNIDSINNIEVIGQFFYAKYFVVFLIAGLVILVSMVSAITITLKTRETLKRQFIHLQVSRNMTKATFKSRSIDRSSGYEIIDKKD